MEALGEFVTEDGKLLDVMSTSLKDFSFAQLREDCDYTIAFNALDLGINLISISEPFNCGQRRPIAW